MGLKEIEGGDTEWIYMAKNEDQWQAVVSIVMKLL
jgi:hypothetical protein